jgi:UDP-2-acetamido-2,6-beta-L-arabino-hexul-4-ose reductase
MIESVVVREIPLHTDTRGWLMKVVPGEFVGDSGFGEIYLSGAKPGETKGGHYHEETTEWFCVIQGEGMLRLEDIHTNERMALNLSRENRLSVEIPPGVAHSVLNVGDEEMILLAFANVPYDPDNPDTIPRELGDSGHETGI